jgi:hypothetical protein
MKRYLDCFDSAPPDAVEQSGREMKPCGRSGYRSALASEDGLISLAV